MAQVTQSNIHGSHSGNTGNNNVIGSNNTVSNTYVLPDATNSGAGYQNEVGGGVPRPYRLISYPRNRAFTGRKTLMESVRRFSEPTGHNRIALYGLGGSGKTQIALEYVYRCITENDSDVFWVQGSGVLKFSEGFRAVAEHAQIPLASAETDEEGFLQGVRKWFEGPNSGDWILVVDNADNEADFVANDSPIARFIPQGTKGTLIFTTRSRLVASRQDCEMIEVGKMGEEEAEELFLKRYGNCGSLGGEEKKVISMILGAVHHLPLAIAGSVAFMVETATRPSSYWAIFQKNEERMRKLLSHQFRDIRREADETESVLSTYFVTFDRITQQMPAAAHLLRLMVFYDRQNIPEELLSQCCLEGLDDPVEFRQAIGNLLGFSLVTIVKHEDKALYELHRLVQLSLQAYFPAEELGRWRAAALKVVSRFFPQFGDQWRHVGPAYIQHALAVTTDSTDPVSEELCFRMGNYFLEMGSYNDAEIQIRRCIALRAEGNEYDWDDDGDDSRFHFLGLVSSRQGKYDESEAINRGVLERREKIHGPDHPDTLTSTHNLALVLRYQGKYNESETMHRRELEGSEKVLGPDHPNTLTSVSSLAAVLQAQGKYDESETMNRRALEGQEKVLGPDHPDTLTSTHNLALVLRYQGKYNESETMHRRELEGSEKVLGPDHPNTLTSVSSLAAVLQAQGKYDESETMNRRALEGYEKVLGSDHPNTLTSVSSLAAVLQAQGKYDESETMNRRALEGREKVLGPDHPNTIASVNNLAVVLRYQRKCDESETISRRALEGPEGLLGPGHPDIKCQHSGSSATGPRKHDEPEAMNQHLGERLPREPHRTGPRFIGRAALRSLRSIVFSKDHRRTK